MAQNRKPPAYQEYAATILSDRNFRLMTLSERGLLYSMRLECWANINVPENPKELAKYLSYETSDINNALTERVKAFFLQKSGNFICPELEDYRKHLNDIKIRQSEGGKQGAKKTNMKHKQVGDSAGNSQVTRECLVKNKSDQLSQTQPLETDDFISSYNDYEKYSNGG